MTLDSRGLLVGIRRLSSDFRCVLGDPRVQLRKLEIFLAYLFWKISGSVAALVRVWRAEQRRSDITGKLPRGVVGVNATGGFNRDLTDIGAHGKWHRCKKNVADTEWLHGNAVF